MIKIGLFLLILTTVAVSEARDLRIVYKNNLGVVKARLQKNQEALDQFIGLTAKDPSDAVLQFNLASSLQALGEMEKSTKLYTTLLSGIQGKLAKADEAEKTELLQLKFMTLFNLGAAYQMMQNPDLALQNYQAALELNPESKEIKTNIEMMFAGGGGKGKGKKKDQKDKGDGEGESEQGDDPQDGDDQKDQEQKQKEQKQKDQQGQGKPKEFDQKYMSNEDLKRIMEELKDQEQKIRAKMERKGGKNGNGNKEKEW